jgi:hypothetical protein
MDGHLPSIRVPDIGPWRPMPVHDMAPPGQNEQHPVALCRPVRATGPGKFRTLGFNTGVRFIGCYTALLTVPALIKLLGV